MLITMENYGKLLKITQITEDQNSISEFQCLLGGGWADM